VNSRLKKLYGKLEKEKVEAFLLNKDVNISYLSGFRGSEALALVSPKENLLITDRRFLEESKDEVTGFRVKIKAGSVYTILRRLCQRLKIRRLGFEGTWFAYEEFKKLKDELGSIELVSTSGLVEALREEKGPRELKFIRYAAEITDRALGEILDLIRPGLTEEELAREIDHILRVCGAEASSFPTIVTSGRRTSLPHGRPTKKKIEADDPVLIDFGACYGCYNSDLTRMVFLGRMSRKFRKIYNLLLCAQKIAIRKIRPGVRVKDLDGVVRQYLAGKGLGKFFGHGLGHGVGREIHESPQVWQKNTARLRDGMVFTVEPAVYIPGWGGLRIEDMVLVTKGGAEILTNSPREIINLK